MGSCSDWLASGGPTKASRQQMKIDIYVDQTGIDLRIFHFLRVHLQSAGYSDTEINCTQDYSILDKSDKRVLFSSMPRQFNQQLEYFDHILLSNADEPTTVATDCLIENLNRDNARLIANAWLDTNHELYHKILPFNNDFLISRQYWTSAFFPQYHAHHTTKNSKTKHLMFINGQNRSWRHHAMEEIKKQIPTMHCHSILSSVIHETNDTPWESPEDQAFREFVNNQYPVSRNAHSDYYEKSILVKIPPITLGMPHGDCLIPPGFFITNFYYQYRCIIFPESNWTNGEASPTEKIAKCFFTKTLPWPVGGAQINQIYNSLGFFTAWNLLPATLQDFDQEINHIERYRKMALAIRWLADHPTVLDSEDCNKMLEKNYVQFLCNDMDLRSVANLQKLLLDQ